jgi:hypothetical protein
MQLKTDDHSKPCRVVFELLGRHVFGGPAVHAGSTPAGSSVPMHLLMSLDTADPLFPLAAAEGELPAHLPLYYPLRYGLGGGEVQYEVLNADTVQILSICNETPDDEEYPFMLEFPSEKFSLKAFTYTEYRAFLIYEQGRGMKVSPADRRIVMNGVEPGTLIQFGGAIFPIGGQIRWRCANRRCKWKGKETTINVFCRVSATPLPGVQIFGEYGTDVEIYFGLCRMCGTIITVNRCT